MRQTTSPFEKQILVSRRLVIRAYNLSDWHVWHRAMAARLPRKNKFDYGVPPAEMLTRQAYQYRVAAYRAAAQKNEAYNFGIFHRSSHEHLGNVSIYILQGDPMKWANIGYQIHNHKQGRGYAKEAARLAVDAGFELLGLHRLEAVMEKDHLASIAVAKAAGMVREGIRKKF
ncbi:MAG: GNAT family N-acetyltransferase, partial [Bdellovibrionaceae bacterium]|nr:GNAT family N-acetyltransferase [Pseudobdellovibrionaceae bacterium]